MSEQRTQKDSVVALILALGVVVGLVISGLAMLFTGAGHGWGSGVMSSTSMVGAPLAAVGWIGRGHILSRTCGALALLVGLGTDVWLWIETARGGVSYLDKVWDVMPLLLLLWTILFLGWQLVAAIAVFRPRTLGR